MPTIYDLTREQLSERLVAWGEPPFRGNQVWTQLWKRAAMYDQMSDIPPVLRERLAADLPLGVEVLDERTADRGATRKALLRLGGEHAIETVLMGYRDRVTVCVSSQSGCAMGCTFCATGQMGLQNNLTSGEIAAQAVWARREASRLPASTPQRLSNVVFMGMGEPIGGCLLLRSTNTSTGPLTMTSVAATSLPCVGAPRLQRGSNRGRIRVDLPETRYAKTVDGVYIAYQTVGDGPIDIVWQFDWLGNVDTIWEYRPSAEWFRGLASFSRLILHDRRGTGASSRTRQEMASTRPSMDRHARSAAPSRSATAFSTSGSRSVPECTRASAS